MNFFELMKQAGISKTKLVLSIIWTIAGIAFAIWLTIHYGWCALAIYMIGGFFVNLLVAPYIKWKLLP